MNKNKIAFSVIKLAKIKKIGRAGIGKHVGEEILSYLADGMQITSNFLEGHLAINKNIKVFTVFELNLCTFKNLPYRKKKKKQYLRM